MFDHGFPIVKEINAKRDMLFNDSHDDKKSRRETMGAWFGHKVVSVASFPANGLAVGLGLIGVTTSLTLGVFKVMTFALTLGHIKPRFSTRLEWFSLRTANSFRHLFANGVELVYDLLDLIWNIFRRVIKGIEISLEDELKNIGDSWETIPLLNELNQTVRECAWRTEDARSLKNWGKHIVLSLLNIPANAAVACVAGAVSFLTSQIFLVKALFVGMTDCPIHHSTGFIYSAKVCLVSTSNILENGCNIFVDLAIAAYNVPKKIAVTLHITRPLATVWDVIRFIPEGFA